MSHNFRVLLVDDDPNVQTMFQMVMEHYGITLDIASDEASTVAFLEQYRHHLIVLDIFLAGTDGYQVLQTIRKFQGDNLSPVIAITAYYTSDTMDDVLRAGFDSYMLKDAVGELIFHPYLLALLPLSAKRRGGRGVRIMSSPPAS